MGHRAVSQNQSVRSTKVAPARPAPARTPAITEVFTATLRSSEHSAALVRFCDRQTGGLNENSGVSARIAMGTPAGNRATVLAVASRQRASVRAALSVERPT